MTKMIRDKEDLWREFQGEMVGTVKSACETLQIDDEDRISYI